MKTWNNTIVPNAQAEMVQMHKFLKEYTEKRLAKQLGLDSVDIGDSTVEIELTNTYFRGEEIGYFIRVIMGKCYLDLYVGKDQLDEAVLNP